MTMPYLNKRSLVDVHCCLIIILELTLIISYGYLRIDRFTNSVKYGCVSFFASNFPNIASDVRLKENWISHRMLPPLLQCYANNKQIFTRD